MIIEFIKMFQKRDKMRGLFSELVKREQILASHFISFFQLV